MRPQARLLQMPGRFGIQTVNHETEDVLKPGARIDLVMTTTDGLTRDALVHKRLFRIGHECRFVLAVGRHSVRIQSAVRNQLPDLHRTQTNDLPPEIKVCP